MCYNPTHYIHLITHSPARAKSDPPLKTRHKTVACFLHPLGALPSPAGAHTRGILGARLARFRAPWPLCSNAEPQELRHGGRSSAGLALLPSSFLELRGDSRWTHFLSEVNMPPGRGSAEPRCSLSRRILSLCLFPDFSFHLSPVFFHQQRRSEEHNLVTSCDWRGCGHRAQENSRYTRTRRMHGKVIRASRWRGEKWSISRGEEGEFFPAAEQQPPPTTPRPPASLGRIIPPPPPLILHLDTLRHSF